MAWRRTGLPPTPRKRFAVEDDIQLLHEVLRQNPFTDSHLWTSVAHSVNVARDKEFTSRGCRERTELLIGLLRKGEWPNPKKSGMEEIFKEKEALLQRVSDLEAEFVPASKSRAVISVRRSRPWIAPKETATAVVEPVAFVADTTKQDSSSSTMCHLYEQQGETSSQASIVYESHDDDTITGDEDVIFPSEGVTTRWPSKRVNDKLRSDTESALQGFAKQQAIRVKELEIEERKLKLEEERLSLERARFEAEREFEMRRLQMEEDDRRSRRESEKLQADLMKTMFEVFVKRTQ